MGNLIYLDQNILSELRHRKLMQSEDSSLTILKNAFLAGRFQLIYSYVNLEEIFQISNIDYQQEHITLLNELSAMYINPKDGVLYDLPASQVWTDYKSNKEFNHLVGITRVIDSCNLISKHSLGLISEQTLSDLSLQCRENILAMLLNSKEMVMECNDEIEKLGINLDVISDIFDYSLKNIEDQFLAIPLDTPNVSIREFRESDEINKLNFIKSENVITDIRSALKIDKNLFDITDYFPENTQVRIAEGYSLMNLAGYHPDDFCKNSKKSDRFNASKNDMLHIISASDKAKFFISNDKKLCEKAKQAFIYSKVNVAVYDVIEFIDNYISSKE